MTAIVMNTKSGAVTEYDWTFHSITPTRAGSDAGLFSLGADTDNGVAIAATLRTGKTLMDSAMLKIIELVFFAMTGAAASNGRLRVLDDEAEYTYQFLIQPEGVSRAKPGRGIRANYLAVGFSNMLGADFRIDRIEADVFPSRTRRTN